jgi:hypothetical protein
MSITQRLTHPESIVKPAAQSRIARLSALLFLSGLMSFAQQHVVGYYQNSLTFPLSNLVANGSAKYLTI